MPKYHLGVNGPAVCKAEKVACRYASHGTESEMLKAWEQEQSQAHAQHMYGISVQSELESAKEAALELLSQDYSYDFGELISYTDEEVAVATKLAPLTLSELSYAPIELDASFELESTTEISRYSLPNGEGMYFKHMVNTEFNESILTHYEATTLSTALNEANAYRAAQLMGDGYSELVPETSFRIIDGVVGTASREVPEDPMISQDFASEPQLQDDVRRAALFDFVIGSHDRHETNFLYGVEQTNEGRKSRIKLIDNGLSFPPPDFRLYLYSSVFTRDRLDGYKLPDRLLRSDERVALNRLRSGVEAPSLASEVRRRSNVSTVCLSPVSFWNGETV
jgi:hypothetical protein